MRSAETPKPHRRAVLAAAVAAGAASPLAATADTRSTALFASDMPRASRSGWAEAADGQRIRWNSFGEGPETLVLVHGWMCDSSYWAPQIKRFSATHQVIALDLPGHGQSDKTRKDWTMAAYADDVARVAAAAAPGRKVTLVGHSMGGVIVCVAGARMPAGALAGVVPVDILFTTAPMRGDGKPRPPAADFAATTRKMVRDGMFLPSADPVLADRIADAMAAGPRAIAEAAGAAMAAVDIRSTLATMATTPLSIINSARWPTQTAEIRQAHPGARAVVFKDAGHFVMLDDPAGFDTVLANELLVMGGRVSQS